MADMDFDQTIGIAPQFSSYALDERQVLLLSEQRSFRLTGKLYVALLPFLDGSRTVSWSRAWALVVLSSWLRQNRVSVS